MIKSYSVGKTLEKEKKMRSAVCEMPQIIACIGCSAILAWYSTNPNTALVAADVIKVVRRPISSTHAAENLPYLCCLSMRKAMIADTTWMNMTEKNPQRKMP